MRRRRPLIVWICLLALVWCQTAMAAQWCHGGVIEEQPAALDCHGAAIDEGSTDATCCPVDDVLPDPTKLHALAPLPPGHDFPLTVAAGQTDVASYHRFACPRDGPSLSSLCRLLI
jgi:hypothetical protein